MPRGRLVQVVVVRLIPVEYSVDHGCAIVKAAVLSALLSIFLKVTYSELRSIYTATCWNAHEGLGERGHGGGRTELLVPCDVSSDSDSDQRCPSC